MAVRIRLQRHGRKRKAFYWIVAADSRVKRDGKYLEKIGTYNPNTVPAIIDLDNDKALEWLQKGAQPSDTARAILSYKGVLYKKHLLRGVSKGAFSIEEAETKYQAWLEEKNSKISGEVDKIQKAAEAEAKKQLAAEKAIAEARLAAQTPAQEEAPEASAEVAEEEAPKEQTIDDVAAEAGMAEATPVAEEAPAAEAKEEEAPVAEAKEEKAPKAEEKPAEEESKEG